VPSQDPAVKLQDLRLQHPQLDAKGGNTRPGNLRYAPVAGIGGDSKQLFNTLASHRGYDTELGHVSSDSVDHRSLLTDEELACAVEHQTALLLRRLGLDEPHVGPGYRFTDGLGISGIVLLSLDVRLHIGRRHQPQGMAKPSELARPIMRCSAGFDPDQARR
jgi:hypothetical protein